MRWRWRGRSEGMPGWLQDRRCWRRRVHGRPCGGCRVDRGDGIGTSGRRQRNGRSRRRSAGVPSRWAALMAVATRLRRRSVPAWRPSRSMLVTAGSSGVGRQMSRPAVYKYVGSKEEAICTAAGPALGAWWGELGSDLGDADFRGYWLRPPPAAAVPRESPPDLARLWHGTLLISVRRRDGEVVEDLGWSAASLDLLRSAAPRRTFRWVAAAV